MTLLKTFLLHSALFLSILSTYAQVTIGSNIPPERIALLDIKEKRPDIESGDLSTVNRGGLLLPRVYLINKNELTPFVDPKTYTTSEYNNLKIKSKGVIVYNLSQKDNFIEGLYKWDGDRWLALITENDLNKINFSTAANFVLPDTKTDFLNGKKAGEAHFFAVKEMFNTTSGNIKLSNDGLKITLKPGIYIIRFTYEARHNANGCTISSYFVDFPSSDSAVRTHSTASHIEGTPSSHGSDLSSATIITQDIDWRVHLGRGQSGNCLGTGCTLLKNSTQIYIERLNTDI